MYNEDPKDHYAEAKAFTQWHSDTFGNWNKTRFVKPPDPSAFRRSHDCLDDIRINGVMSRVPAYKNGRTLLPLDGRS